MAPDRITAAPEDIDGMLAYPKSSVAPAAARRDARPDDRIACTACTHLLGDSVVGWRCRRPLAAGMPRVLPRDFVNTLQRCNAFQGGTHG